MATPSAELFSRIDEILSLLSAGSNVRGDTAPIDETLASLVQQCRARCFALDAEHAEPLRTIHHFACTGGTLIARCIEAQPNVVLLSEIDPFSTMALKSAAFAPHDLIRQAQIGLRPLTFECVKGVFIAALTEMHRTLAARGQRLVIRDHPHSHFCTGIDPASRPTLRDALKNKFALRSVTTVRHPLDSFLSLKKNGWVHFAPASLDEYCRRYLLFLDAYADTPIVRYEDFVDDPRTQAENIARILELACVDHWPELLSAIKMTGDSGRKGETIERRERRAVPPDIADECAQSRDYAVLCERLGYNPEGAAAPT